MKNLLALQLNMRAGTVQTGRAVSIATRLQGGTTETRDLTPRGDSFFSLLARSHWLWASISLLPTSVSGATRTGSSRCSQAPLTSLVFFLVLGTLAF